MPAVDVVIPCYRYGHVLPIAVRSVLDQPGVDVRVLVVDDASPDGSAEVARALAEQDDRVEVRVHAENRGHIATYNEGLLGWARAEYSVLLSADDALTPGALGRATALLDAHPGVGFAYGRPVHWDGSTPLPPARTRGRGWRVYDGPGWLRRRFRTGQGCITSPEVVFRTELQHRVGGYDPELRHSGDIEMWMRFAAHGDVGFLRGVDQAYYRVHGENMSAAYYGGSGVGDLEQRLAAYRSVVQRHGDRIPGVGAMEARVRRTLAREALVRAGRAYDKGLTGTVPVEELRRFAASAVPDPARLAEWHTLNWRDRLGPRRAQALRPLVLTPAGRALRRRWARERWLRSGV